MHQVRRPKVQGPDVKLALFLFVAFGVGFPIVYIRWRYPIILFVCCNNSPNFKYLSFDEIQYNILFTHLYRFHFLFLLLFIQVSYGTLILNIAWMDLCLLFSQYTHSGIAMYATGLAMQVQYCVIFIHMYILIFRKIAIIP